MAMDPRPLLPLLGGVVTLGFAGILLVILHLSAVRHGGSLLKNPGRVGWAIAFEVVLAAGMFSAVVTAVLATPFNFPVDWTMVLTEGPIIGALGAGIFFLAWRTLIRHLPRVPPPASQKG